MCWYVGGSAKQGHGSGSTGWCMKGPLEKSVLWVRKQAVRGMKTAKTKLRKKARRGEGHWQRDTCRVGWKRELGLADSGEDYVVSETGGDGRRRWTSSSFSSAGLCPILGSVKCGVLAKQWAPFHGASPFMGLPRPVLDSLKPFKLRVLFHSLYSLSDGFFRWTFCCCVKE